MFSVSLPTSYPIMLSRLLVNNAHSDWLPSPPGEFRREYHRPRTCIAMSLGSTCLMPLRHRSTEVYLSNITNIDNNSLLWYFTIVQMCPYYHKTSKSDSTVLIFKPPYSHVIFISIMDINCIFKILSMHL